MADIALNKSTSNIITPTLYEKTTLSPVYYLFEFKNTQTKVLSYCIPSELSTELLRYNKFIITDVASPNPLLGQVDLSRGTYSYIVYEQSSATNLIPTGLNAVEEDGICRVYGTPIVNTEYPVATVTNTEYEP